MIRTKDIFILARAKEQHDLLMEELKQEIRLIEYLKNRYYETKEKTNINVQGLDAEE